MAKMLSEHFSEDEFRCHDGQMHTINPSLLGRLEKLRTLANKSIHVNCGYRDEVYNKKVGGAPKSQHLLGNAADIVISGFTPKQVYDMALKVGFTGVGLYDTFTHVDVRPVKKVVTWDLRTKK